MSKTAEVRTNEKRPLGNCKVLALYKRVVVLYEVLAYLVVVEAIDHRNEESLKRGGRRESKLFLCAFMLISNHCK